MRAMLTKTELDALRGALRNKLLPELGAVRERRQDQYDETDDSHQHMEPFRDVAEALQKEFSEDDEVQGVIAREESLCEQWARENVVEDQSPEPERKSDVQGKGVTSSGDIGGCRIIKKKKIKETYG